MPNSKVQDLSASIRRDVFFVAYQPFLVPIVLLFGFLLGVAASVTLSTRKKFFNTLFTLWYWITTSVVLEQWRAALREAADTAGMVLGERYESEFIQDVVGEIKKMLKSKVQDLSASIRRDVFFVAYQPFLVPIVLLFGFLLGVAASVTLSTREKFFNTLFTVWHWITTKEADIRDPESASNEA